MEELYCQACGKWLVIRPILVCWWCRQAGVAAAPTSRRRGKASTRATRRRWTAADDDLLGRTYADTSPAALLELFPGRSISSINLRAALLGLQKSEAYLRAQHAEEGRRLCLHGRAYRFPKGHVPANKGVKGRPSTGRMAETQFKRGQKGYNWKPVGATRLDADGYLQRKVSDTGYPPRDWRNVHVLLWEEAHGPVPPKHRVVFRNGDKRDVRLENLDLITFSEGMRRNTIHNLPPALKGAIQQIAGLRRRITCMERRRRVEGDSEGRNDRRSEGASVQDGPAAE
jgi:hypothetical protein